MTKATTQDKGSAVIFDTANRTFDCPPMFTDTQVLEFCRKGYLMLQGVVPDKINQRTCDYLEGKLPANPSYIPTGMTRADLERIRGTHEPSTILLEDWFIEHVLLNQQLVGVMRSLLGRNVGLPVQASNHLKNGPFSAGDWHHDNDRVFGPELNFIEVFYFPQDTPAQLGPTEVMPGSHIGPVDEGDKAHQAVSAEGPAGTLGIHHQSLLHRRGQATTTGTRHMIKYNYWRTVPPQRDWIVESDFNFHTACYGYHEEARYYAHIFYWLCGKGDAYRIIGGQAWPISNVNQIGPSYGFGRKEGYLPDWRRTSADGYAV